ncbi:Abi family protein [Weissella confusa]|uniref:Abi family protein n=1 Tax=Weissella confusa TaxID=1583 RepID=A0AAJ3DBS1_WEICO|nr:Abi family protein [Weissella confusa]NBA11683.1 hypothetical protein [Weissella confusa]
MATKEFKSLSEQLDILKSRNLTIMDDVSTMERLSSHGYYEIINGYKTTFLIDPENEIFKSGTTFDDIFALYFFDSKIRIAVLEAIEFTENFLRQKLAYTLAEQHSEIFDDYVNKNVFNAGKQLPSWKQRPKKGIFSERDLLFDGFTKIANLNYDPYNHYKNNHGNTPPWILVKGMTFGQLRMAISLLNSRDKQLLIHRIYSEKDQAAMPFDEMAVLFNETLEVLNKFRNRAAHGGRMYNYYPNVGFTYNQHLHSLAKISKTMLSKNKIHSAGLSLLRWALSMWQSGYSVMMLMNGINSALSGYATKWETQIPLVLAEMEFPPDYDGYKQK